MSSPFGDFYRNKTVLITGDSGFKGSWLAIWLRHLGARVVGYSLNPPTDPSNFKVCGLGEKITHTDGDILNLDGVVAAFSDHRPEVVFHLAAQALVRPSFETPRYTFDANVMGTINVLEAARLTDSVRSVVAISSDKCYQNTGSDRGYRETDPLGGQDPYSASKACAEIVIGVYRDARFQKAANPPREIAITSARAGNVIGGGDWALDRIVPDIVRAIIAKDDVVVRNPDAVRPWQHVLEPLSAYMWLGALLTKSREYCSAWNIGPDDKIVRTVEDIVGGILRRWPGETRLVVERDPIPRESKMLRLDCSKANEQLKWHPAWDIDQTLDSTVAWYKYLHEQKPEDMYGFTTQQIEDYTSAARERRIAWTTETL